MERNSTHPNLEQKAISKLIFPTLTKADTSPGKTVGPEAQAEFPPGIQVFALSCKQDTAVVVIQKLPGG